MNEDYAPFPEAELKELATWHDGAAALWPARSFTRGLHEDRAAACRNAVACHVALRERMLIAEMDNRQARAS